MPTNIPNFIPPENFTPILPPELSVEQKEIFNEFSKYVDTILLPEDDPLHQTERSWVTDACLKRYLRASKWYLSEAKARIKYTLEWRREYKPADIEPERVEPEVVTGKMHINGFDKHGRPIIYLRPGLENTKAGPRQVLAVVFMFESAIKLMPKDVENVVIIVDFHECSARKSPGLGIAREFMHVLGSHYPERLAMSLVVNAPWYFWGFFKLIAPFIDPVTKNKIKFVDLENPDRMKSDPQWANILDEIDRNQLESEYGGDQEFVYNFEIYWDTLLKRIGKR
ncbi:8688_t:CDS:2 [Gigaspora margarita]|uniref:CRAL/TRIO domain-containing protein n=2 Tax=Gigaspora margarita TaxID=4874 RepID=A0A8H3WWD0_GIGMA|nr:CRAL/TRIO domain-containing protein [Gigaspora margarita]CAG8467105.1 8688_t:CDS:2 [Gigaspora margarita]